MSEKYEKSVDALRNAEAAFERIMKTYSDRGMEPPENIKRSYGTMRDRRIELESGEPQEGVTRKYTREV